MYPQLPENLAELSAAELRTLALQFREARRTEATAHPKMGEEQMAAWVDAGATATMLDSLAADRDRDELSEAQALSHAQAIAALAANDPEDDEGGEDEGGEAGEGDEGGDDAGDGGDGGGSDLSLPSGDLSLPSERRILTPAGSRWIAGADAGRRGPAEGEAYASTRQIGEVVASLMDSYGGSPDRELVVATMPGNWRPEQVLSGAPNEMFTDWARISTPNQTEIEAAFCTPFQNSYELACANVTRRPVFNGLPVFTMNVDRGGISIPESPSLTDITTGYGQWTSSDDADTEALKTCQTIDCVDWNDFEWYAVYRCLKVKNMMQMVFPELVDAYLNRLQAAWARYAEILLLEAMGTASTAVDGYAQGYGANVSLQRIILNYLGKYADIERWDEPVMDAWMPRWLLWALRMDIASRRKDGGGMVPSVATVEQGFRDVGVEPHWYMDRPTWATAFGNGTGNPFSVNGDLVQFPSTVQILIHRRGKFAVINKGQLQLGLGGNPIRIEEDVRRNQATFFFESFEGLVDTDSCPAHLLTVPGLCYNGGQIADIGIGCSGDDIPGFGSA